MFIAARAIRERKKKIEEMRKIIARTNYKSYTTRRENRREVTMKHV